MKVLNYLAIITLLVYFPFLPRLCFAAKAGEAVMAETKAMVSKPVNINTATVTELEAVKGIGKKKAEAIIAYRNDHGGFKSIEEVSQVKGIGKKRAAKITPQLTIN